MVKKHHFHPEKSKSLYDLMPEEFEVKGCYNNIFRAVLRNQPKFRSKEWKVAFGFVQIFKGDSMYCRHAYILDKAGDVIDPTYYTHEKSDKDANTEYLTFHTFPTIESYANAVRYNDDYPDLWTVLQDKEQKVHKWAIGKYILMG